MKSKTDKGKEQLPPHPAPSQYSRDHSLSLWDVEHELAATAQEYMDLLDDGSDSDLGELIEDGDEDRDLESSLDALAGIVQAYLKEAADKRDKMGRFLSHLDTMAVSHAEEIRRLSIRKKNIEKTKERIKDYILVTMKSLRVNKLEGSLYSFSRRKSPLKVVILDESKIPGKYLVPRPPVPSKQILQADYKQAAAVGADLTVPGVEFQPNNETVVVR